MDILKKIFPYSFGVKDLTDMIVKIIVYVVAGAVAGILVDLIGRIPLPFLDAVASAVGALIGVYGTVGIVLAILDHFKVLK